MIEITAMAPHALLIVPSSRPGMSVSELEKITRLTLNAGQTVVLKGDTFHAVGMPSEKGGNGARIYQCGEASANISGYQL